jgi:hypothetical protein
VREADNHAAICEPMVYSSAWPITGKTLPLLYLFGYSRMLVMCLSQRTVRECVNETGSKKEKAVSFRAECQESPTPHPHPIPLYRIVQGLFVAKDTEVRIYLSLLCAVLCFILNIPRSYWSIFLVLHAENRHLRFCLHFTVFKAPCSKYACAGPWGLLSL